MRNRRRQHTLLFCVWLCVCWLAIATQGVAQDVDSPTSTESDVWIDTWTNVWTLQVGQYHNEQRARSQVSRLQQMGFDAYLELSFAGLIRVRVGCFLSPAAARTVASLLQGRVSAAMVLTPLSADANVQLCTYQQIGFITPAAWGIQQVSPQGVVFWIQLGSQTGYVVYHEGWHVSQDEPRLLEQPTAEPRAELHVDQAAFAMAPLPAVDAALPTVDVGNVVRYQLAGAPELAGTSEDVTVSAPEPATFETRNTSANVEAESSLAASLARLPKYPRVSLQASDETVIDDTKSDNTTDITSDDTEAAPARADVTRSIVIGSGDILWQNDHEVVVYQQGMQQQGRLVSLRVVPVSATFLGTTRE